MIKLDVTLASVLASRFDRSSAHYVLRWTLVELYQSQYGRYSAIFNACSEHNYDGYHNSYNKSDWSFLQR